MKAIIVDSGFFVGKNSERWVYPINIKTQKPTFL